MQLVVKNIPGRESLSYEGKRKHVPQGKLQVVYHMWSREQKRSVGREKVKEGVGCWDRESIERHTKGLEHYL